MINRIPLAISSSEKPEYKLKQEAIRKTWLSKLDLEKFYPLFVINSETKTEGAPFKYIEEDNTLYTKTPDEYRFISNKMKMYYRWALETFSSNNFWRVDDDCYVNCGKFNQYDTQDYDYIGCILHQTPQDGPFAKIYTQFMSGSANCLSRKVAEMASDYLPHAGPDDWWIGSMVYSLMPNAKWKHEDSINPWSYCNNITNLMIGHYIKTEEMEIMHGYYCP